MEEEDSRKGGGRTNGGALFRALDWCGNQVDLTSELVYSSASFINYNR